MCPLNIWRVPQCQANATFLVAGDLRTIVTMSRTQSLLTKIIKLCSEIQDIKQGNKLKLNYLSLTAQTNTQALLPHSRTQVAWVIYIVLTTGTVVPITKTIYHAEHAHLRVMCNLPIVRATCQGHSAPSAPSAKNVK